MKQKCFIDTSIILRIIFQKDRILLKRLVKEFDLYSSSNVLEEAIFKIIVETFRESYGEVNLYKLKSLFEKENFPEVLNKRLYVLNLISDLITVLPVVKEDYRLAKKFVCKYRLLSNDALLLAIALRNGIGKLATFDSDFNIEITKEILSKQDKILEKQDTMLGKMDLMLDKQDETIT